MSMWKGQQKRTWGCLLLAVACALWAGQARAFDEARADRALQFASEQLARMATDPAIPVDQYPKNTEGNRTWKLFSADDRTDWVQGFFPGLLWYMYEFEREPIWRERAAARTRPPGGAEDQHRDA